MGNTLSMADEFVRKILYNQLELTSWGKTYILPIYPIALLAYGLYGAHKIRKMYSENQNIKEVLLKDSFSIVPKIMVPYKYTITHVCRGTFLWVFATYYKFYDLENNSTLSAIFRSNGYQVSLLYMISMIIISNFNTWLYTPKHHYLKRDTRTLIQPDLTDRELLDNQVKSFGQIYRLTMEKKNTF